MLNELRASSASRILTLARHMVYGAAVKMGGSGRTGSGLQQRRRTRCRLWLPALTLAACDARPPAEFRSLRPGHDGLQVAAETSLA